MKWDQTAVQVIKINFLIVTAFEIFYDILIFEQTLCKGNCTEWHIELFTISHILYALYAMSPDIQMHYIVFVSRLMTADV